MEKIHKLERLTLTLVDIIPEDYVIFEMKKSNGHINKIRCLIDVSTTLDKAPNNWWSTNKVILKNEFYILRIALNDFLRTVPQPIIISPTDLEDNEEYDAYFVTLDILKSKQDLSQFEDILAEQCKPECNLTLRGMIKADLISIGKNAEAMLKIETSLADSIQELLKDPKALGIIDKKKKKYLYQQYSKHKVRDYLAPLDSTSEQQYRVRILNKLKLPGAERSLYVTLYLDLGIERAINFSKFTIATRNKRLPSFLQKIPPQVTKTHLSGLGNMDYELLEIHSIFHNNTFNVQLIEALMESNKVVYEVELFKYPARTENQKKIKSFNSYLKWIEKQEIKFTIESMTPEAREIFLRLYRKFQSGILDETDSSFLDFYFQQKQCWVNFMKESGFSFMLQN